MGRLTIAQQRRNGIPGIMHNAYVRSIAVSCLRIGCCAATHLYVSIVGQHNIDPNIAVCAKALDECLRGVSHNFLW